MEGMTYTKCAKCGYFINSEDECPICGSSEVEQREEDADTH